MENKNRAGHARINARGDCTDLASAGSGHRSENPSAFSRGECQAGLCIKKLRVKGFYYGYPDGLRVDLGDIQPVAWDRSIVGYEKAEDDVMQSEEAIRMRRQLEYR